MRQRPDALVIMDRLLNNAATGPQYLCREEIAQIVVDAIRYSAWRQYDLHHFVVLPNDVYILFTPQEAVSRINALPEEAHRGESNRVLGLTGAPFWQDESYDRLVRDEGEFERIAAYIERGPVAAALVSDPAEFRWSSAWKRQRL